MNLSSSLKEKYTQEKISARDAQRLAEFIAWGPVVFQASRLMVKFGIFDRNAGMKVKATWILQGIMN